LFAHEFRYRWTSAAPFAATDARIDVRGVAPTDVRDDVPGVAAPECAVGLNSVKAMTSAHTPDETRRKRRNFGIGR
jgi:hypothetical protein